MHAQELTTQTESRSIPSPRKGAHDGVRTELSVFLKVKPGHEKHIRAVLSSLSGEAVDLAREAVVNVGTLHDARQVLFDNDTRLMIGTSFDGNWDVYVDDFARTSILDLWDKFLIHCEGYPDQGAAPPSLPEIKEFLTSAFQQLLDEASR
jgi:hypothetical protein